MKIRRGLREHLANMSSNATKLYLWLHLACFWAGPKRATVETTYAIIAEELRWTLKMIQRTVAELQAHGYIQVLFGRNQYESTSIRIVNYNGDERRTAMDIDVHSERFGVDKDDHSFVDDSGLNTVRSKRNNSSQGSGLAGRKNAVDGSRNKALRRAAAHSQRGQQSDNDRGPAGLAGGGSTSRKRLTQNLAAKIAEKGRSASKLLDYYERKEGNRYPQWWIEAQQAAAAVGYELDEKSPVVSPDFAWALLEVWEDHCESNLPPGILCTKVIDRCCSENVIWPPDFQDHRDSLRAQEREEEEERCSAKDSTAGRAGTV